MNKTVTINISGIIFHIEELAYEKLSKYLKTIRGYFSTTEGGNEIMSDIEARIAEMLQSKTSAIKQVVLMADVDFVMDSMGKPEEFGADENADKFNNESTEFESSDLSAKKRIYRDGDNKVLGGVCSGVGHYFGFDPVWLRIALLILLFFAGTGVLLYIILWIAIPEAKTIAEKLAMKGEKADINNISKAVKEEAEQLKKRIEKYGNDFKNMANNHSNVPRNAIEKIVDFTTDILMNIGRVLLKIIGILMVIFGVIFFFGLFTTVFGMSFMTNDLEVKEWIDLLLLEGSDFYIGLIGISLFVGIPIIMMVYGGVKLAFKIRYSNRWINLFAGIVWLFGFSLLLYVGVRTGQDFSKTAKVRENIKVIQNDTLILKINEADINYAELQFNDDDDDDEENGSRVSIKNRHSDYVIGKHGNERYLLGYAQLNIIKSQTDRIELVVVKEANGSDKQIAKQRAQHIFYNVKQIDSLLLFDNIFKVGNADKFRKQDISVILKLPVGKVIYIDESLENLIYDIENVTNTFDGDMINRRWIMTENGLKCIDCDGLNNNSSKDDDSNDDDHDVQINVNGIDIHSKDAKINVDSNGVKIHSKDSKVVIDKNGVHVNSKEQH